MAQKIGPNETEIAGGWTRDGDSIIADLATRRIEDLVASHLRELARTEDGWSVLYRDPADERTWELTYPNSDAHGGGPPLLKLISTSQARVKYHV